MGYLIPPLRRRTAPELIESPDLERDELQENLKDLELLNRCFGGVSAIVARFSEIVRRRRLSGSLSVFDAGAGGADIPRALVRWAQIKRLPVRIVACDHHGEILKIASELSLQYPEIGFVEANVLKLPFRPRSFDIATCSLVAHHLNTLEVVMLFRTLDLISRIGFILSDLRRSHLAYAGVWLATRTLCRNRLTRNDGPLSVQRAYTLEEMRELALRTGCNGLQFFKHPFFRIGVVQEKDEAA
jgi:2-polyprenyl-3-methyl-5-hydroxy-6-metoxy-1,4-benzoquinol methylase